MNTTNTLDDLTLIQQFIQGRAKLSFNQNLRVEPVADTVQLLTKKGLLLATVNLASQFKIIFVRQESTYWQQINQVLLENQLMPVGKIINGLMRYEYHPVPIGYQINYAEALNLWKIWQNYSNQKLNNAPINLLIFAHETWQPIQEMAFSQESVFIKTYASQITIHSCDRMVWISPCEENLTSAIVTQPATPTDQSNLESKTVNNTSEQLEPVSQNLLEPSKMKDQQLVSQFTSSKSTKNILSIDKGKLYIQTIEGEIVVEGSNLKFWFSPPEGQNIIPQPIEVK